MPPVLRALGFVCGFISDVCSRTVDAELSVVFLHKGLPSLGLFSESIGRLVFSLILITF